MGKKRGTGNLPGQSSHESAHERPSKLKINSYEDVADSEDEFYLNRDKILLDESKDAKNRRKQLEREEFLQQDEIIANAGDPTSDDDEEEDGYEDAEIFEDEGVDARNGRTIADEVDNDNEGWGTSKSDYYNADVIETEQDAADEEAEAIRLQRLQAVNPDEAFNPNDWLGEDEEADVTKVNEDEAGPEQLQHQLRDDMSPEHKLCILKERYPEFESLALDFQQLQPLHSELSLAAAAAEKLGQTRNSVISAQGPSPVAVKFQALSAYLSSIAMYFAVLTSTFSEETGVITAKDRFEMRNHPVIDTLFQCRSLWGRVKDLTVADDLLEDEDVEDGDILVAPAVKHINGDAVHHKARVVKAIPRVKVSKAQRAAEKARTAALARDAERKRKTEEDLAGLSELAAQIKRRKLTTPIIGEAGAMANPDDSDLGEETELTAEALAEKARRKKSLKFYTSQIAQKSNKRSAATRDYGGDTDVPHRERLRDRQMRLNAEAEKRGKKKQDLGEDLGGESDEEDRRQAREVRDEDQGSDDDDYYDMVAARSKKRKTEKTERARAYAQAAREGGQVIEEETIGADGKRAIGYVISKNKGLAPKRGKNVISRVKKRQRYEGAKKKLKSMKPVYSGGEGRGGYGGELTGIKKGLVKSVKL